MAVSIYSQCGLMWTSIYYIFEYCGQVQFRGSCPFSIPFLLFLLNTSTPQQSRGEICYPTVYETVQISSA